MVRHMFAIVLLSTTTAVVSPAAAAPYHPFTQTYACTVAGDGTFRFQISYPPQTYFVNFTLSQATSLDAQVIIRKLTIESDPRGVTTNENSIYSNFTFSRPVASGAFTYKIAPMSSVQRGLITTDTYYIGSYVTFDLHGNPSENISYRATLTAAPEPAQWGLMIGAFALAGAALRRRRALASFADLALI